MKAFAIVHLAYIVQHYTGFRQRHCLGRFSRTTARYSFAWVLPIVVIVASILSLAQTTTSNALSKDKLIALKDAGLSDSVLIQQIQKDGINFDLNADTTLELKRNGLSNDVLSALISASRTQHVASGQIQTGVEAQVRALYDQQKYVELADYLKKQLAINPSDFKYRSLLILSLVKLNDTESATQELAELKRNAGHPHAVKYIQKVEALIAGVEQQKESKAKLLAALQSFNVQQASATIDQLSISDTQKELLRVILDSYQGNFGSAHARMAKMPSDSYSQKQQFAKIDARLKETQEQYEKLLAHTDIYIHSPYAPSACFGTQGHPEAYHEDYYKLTVADYLESVSRLFKLTPLNSSVLNLVFHAEMLVGDYDQVQNLGDRILSGKGTIRLPFFSRDKYFDTVIDKPNQKIYSVVDPRPFIVQYPENGYSHKSADHNNWNAEFVPFDLSFAEITSVTQHVAWSGYRGDFVKSRPYVLKFSPSGQAPNYAVMLLLGCTAGSEAQQRATRTLGQYVVHVIGRSDLHAELVDPSRKPSGNSWMDTAMVSFWSGMAAGSGNAALAYASSSMQQAFDSARVNGEASEQGQQDVWSSLVDQQATVLSQDSFSEVESLLGLLDR